MKRVAIYSRKSKETDTGESIKNQINICKNYFKNQNLECSFEVFIDEGFSGGNTNRPAFKKMLKLCTLKKFDIIAIYKIDRMARNITDFFSIYNKLEKNNITLISVTEGFDATTPIGRMMMTMLAGFADMERENIKQRVKDNMYELAKLGRWSGGTPPTGYKSITKVINGKKSTYLNLINEECNNIISIFELCAKGFTSTQIGKKLNMNPKTILNIIQNPTYLKSDIASKNYLESIGFKVYGQINGKGYLSYGRRPRKNGQKLNNSSNMFVAVSEHEGIVDSSLWIKANNQLSKRSKKAKPRTSTNSFLSHLVKCSCGNYMFISSGRKRKDGSKSFYFRCTSKVNKNLVCNNKKSLRVDLAEKYILKELLNIKISEDLLKEHILNNTKHNDLNNKIKSIKNKIQSNNLSINNLSKKLLYVNGNTLIILNDKINNLALENSNLNNELLDLNKKSILENETINSDILKKRLNILLKNFDSLPLDQKQVFIRSLIKEIIFDGDQSIEIIFNDC